VSDLPDSADPNNPRALARLYDLKLFRVNFDKIPPRGSHGFYDATSDQKTLDDMERALPRGLWAMRTGCKSRGGSGLSAVDIDMRLLKNGLVGWGLDSLEAEGISTQAETTWTFHTLQGGYQRVFTHPPIVYVKSGSLRIDGRPVPFVEGDLAYTVLPPGPGRWWDFHLAPHLVSPAPLPAWPIMPAPPPPERSEHTPPRDGDPLTPYCEKILRNACREIERTTSNKHDAIIRVAHNVAGYVANNGMPEALALFELEQAALALDEGRRSEKSILETVRSAFAAGKARAYDERKLVR
jgi:hypothetical protein